MATRVSFSSLLSSVAAAESQVTGGTESAAAAAALLSEGGRAEAAEGRTSLRAAAGRGVGCAPATAEFDGRPAATASDACFFPATALLAGLSAIALWPEQPLAVVPGVSRGINSVSWCD